MIHRSDCATYSTRSVDSRVWDYGDLLTLTPFWIVSFFNFIFPVLVFFIFMLFFANFSSYIRACWIWKRRPSVDRNDVVLKWPIKSNSFHGIRLIPMDPLTRGSARKGNYAYATVQVPDVFCLPSPNVGEVCYTDGYAFII